MGNFNDPCAFSAQVTPKYSTYQQKKSADQQKEGEFSNESTEIN
jgi:hypothetical protein